LSQLGLRIGGEDFYRYWRSSMGYRTILVHCDAGKRASCRLDVAAELAGRFGSMLVGLHVRTPLDAPLFADTTFSMTSMAPIFDAFDENTKADQAASRSAYDKALKGIHLQSEWRVVDDYAETALIVASRYADLMVVGQTGPENASATPPNLPEAVALATGRPVLVVPHIGAQKPPGKKVMLCWNASRESARAAADALPFLKAADEVVVLIVEPTVSAQGHGAEPGSDVATWLARHGVKVTVQREAAADSDVGDIVVSRASDLGTDLIVMGAYGHSRLRELVLGGVSRTLLASMTVPVLMSH
jgi:nucleotide-binding universal stress UspA family protein